MNNQTLEAKLYGVLATYIMPERLTNGTDYRLKASIDIQELYESEGYTKKHQILYGTKYPDPRPCTKNSHFVEHEQSDCGCGYTKGMSK